MTPLYLAYSHENAPLADQIAAELTDIDCIRHTDKNQTAGQFANALQETEYPVVLLITDNFLKNEWCMSGALGMLLSLMRQNRVLPVVANGISITDGQEIVVETHIDRVINAIQYMNYWQQEYLALNDRYNHVSVEEHDALQEKLQIIHSIADQTGEFISALRDADYVKWDAFSATSFTEVYRKLNIPHTAEKPDTEPPAPAQTPEPPPAKTTIPVSGPVLFQPATPVWPLPPQPEAADTISHDPIAPPEFHTESHLVDHTAHPEDPGGDIGQYREQEIQEMIRDAWGWIERGNKNLGLEVLRLAVEQYPDHIQIRDEYERAQGAGIEVTEITDFEQEANSYEAAGDSAFNDGDYLMAKYCWDRAAESNQNLAGIWRKLGLLTSEHLTGYHETSIAYLQKALLQNPEDTTVIERLTALGAYTPPPAPEIHPLVVQEETIAATTVSPEIHPLMQEEAIAAIPELPETQPLIQEETIPAVQELATPPDTVPEPVDETSSVEEKQDNMTNLAAETAHPYVTAPEMPLPRYPVHRNEIVLITGATSGIGRATAVEFARHGYRLIITGRRAEKLYEVKEQLIAAFNVEVLPLVFDVRDPEAVESTLLYLPESWSNIDILINNAGLAKGFAPIHEGNLDHWETMIDTNIKGLLYVSRIISQGMVKRRRGHIINLGSTAGKETYPNGNVYSATKFAVEALTLSMRLDLHQHNIRVSQVSPGHVEETEFAINRFDGDTQRARIYDDFQPLKASDVAETIWFIASRPAHVNIQDVWMFGTQQASATVVDRSGRG